MLAQVADDRSARFRGVGARADDGNAARGQQGRKVGEVGAVRITGDGAHDRARVRYRAARRPDDHRVEVQLGDLGNGERKLTHPRDQAGQLPHVGSVPAAVTIRTSAPVSEAEAAGALAELNIAEVLNGYRGRDRADVRSLARLVARISQLALAIPEIAELDLNPVIAGRQAAR